MTAGYLVQGPHVLPLSAPGSKRAELSGHGVLVRNASLAQDAVRDAADLGAITLSSFNAQMLASAGPSNPFFVRMRADLAAHRQLTATGSPVVNPDFGDTYFDWRDVLGARAYAAWILDNTSDNLYLDDFVEAIPPSRIAHLEDPTIAAYWPAWREEFVGELRRLAPLRIIVANRGGGKPHRKLNGICYERTHRERAGKLLTLARYVVQANIGRKPTVNIDWAGEWDMPPFGIVRGVFFPTDPAPVEG